MKHIAWILALALPAAQAAPELNCYIPGKGKPAHCGELRRPLNPQRADGPGISIRYIVIPTKAPHPGHPVFFLAGGPGQSASRFAGALAQLLKETSRKHDLVFVDQRGTGQSAPLPCPEDSRQGSDPARYAGECLQRLAKTPWGQPQFFTTSIAAQDMEAVRRHLGYGKADLLGVSYGTRLALEWQRQYPDSIDRQLLDSVVPPDINLPLSAAVDADRALRQLLQRCAEDQDCKRRYPQLSQRVADLLNHLPPTIKLPRLSGGIHEQAVPREQILDWIRQPLYAPASSRALPAALYAASQGNWLPLSGLGQQGGRQLAYDPLAISLGMHLSAVCAEDMPLYRPAAAPAGLFGDGLAKRYRQMCAQWPVSPAPAAFYQLTPSAGAVWMLAGSADPITPPRHAQRLAGVLGRNARVSVIPNAGHNVIGLACLPQAAAEFFDAPDSAAALKVDIHCADKLPAARAFVPPSVENPS
ncbi:alpha/beta hydrolase [Chromobacterium sp. IIBBL 290-4]|uniref:alpha/beta hydrolase n=1 Tax=Chromobacterium sp. IIBBL 290-4 TaxID=2953890 RepID=UPI0020B7F06B|nr:alpha/beta hydrolase [Chromobacterium sp. IIBBL 290-4]UTH75098.1 alpha/beta hydrolase [Chromobacterium sp. IIBBL 290-4]